MMNRAYIFIGSNIDREKNYLEAVKRLAAIGTIVAASSVYDTAPLGNARAGNFYNGAVLIETPLRAHEVRQELRRIEAQLGRVRDADRNAPRTMDLDLVLYNEQHIEADDFIIPDPLILERPFMARALAEISPNYVHPRTGRTLAQIAQAFGANPRGMRVDAAMSARVRQVIEQIHAGEKCHA